MSSFPGIIYDGDGKSLDLTVPDLAPERISSYPHRSIILSQDMAPTARVWLLADDATSDAVPPDMMIEAVELILAGKSVLLLAYQPEPEVSVRTGLLRALRLFTASPDTTGRA